MGHAQMTWDLEILKKKIEIEFFSEIIFEKKNEIFSEIIFEKKNELFS